MAAQPDADAVPLDVTKMTKVQKLAALLIVIGPEAASQVMKNLDEHELDIIAAEMAKMPMIPQDLQKDILKEFTDVAVEASTGILGGVNYTQTALEKSVGVFRATNIVGRVSPTRTPVATMQAIIEMEPRQIHNLIKQEQPQTIALVMSYLGAAKSAQLLVLLRPEIREQVVERLATLAATPIEVVEKLVEVLNNRVGTKPTRALNQTGGMKMTAELLNSLDKNISKTLLIALEERNAELGAGIRQKMFTFEDLTGLDMPSLQKVLREIDMRDLAVSLKSASDKLKTTLLACISKRAAETVNEEMSFMGPLKLKDIEAAQGRIIEVVRRLESEGEIEIDSGKGNEG
ncbi:MAG: flagellar motor switch protein FliG [Verrucomicrobia bacterium]|nr:flagellar motor switch protein FliG [Verrucomicrobiota bacterium]